MKLPSRIKTRVEKYFPFKDEESESISRVRDFGVIYAVEETRPDDGGGLLETVTAGCWIASRESDDGGKHQLELKFQVRGRDYNNIEDDSTCSGQMDDFNQIKQQAIDLMKKTLPNYVTRVLPSH